MKRKHAIPVVLVLAAALGTAAIVALRQPDVIHATGDQGRVRVDGRGVGELVIVHVGERDDSGIPVEDISLDGLPIPASFLLTLSYDPAVRAKAPRPLSLFAYDAVLAAWRSIPTAEDAGSTTLSAYAAVASRRWTYAVLPDDTLPSGAATVIDQLVSFPPTGAVGYRAFAAVSPHGDDFFLLNDDLGQGGCDGTFRRGRDQTVTSHDVAVSGLAMRYEVQWELADGCVDGGKLAPSL